MKDLKVNRSSVNLKQGKVVKNIRLTNNAYEINGKVDGMSIILKTAFVKKKLKKSSSIISLIISNGYQREIVEIIKFIKLVLISIFLF